MSITDMQELARRLWSHDSHCHIGDLAWQYHVGSSVDGMVWRRDGQVVAWVGADGLLVDPTFPADEVVAMLAGRPVEVLDRETHVIEALTRAGYVREDGPYHAVYMSRTLDDLPDPVLPAGFTAHTRALTSNVVSPCTGRRGTRPG